MVLGVMMSRFCGLKPQASFGLYFLTPMSLLALIPFQIVFRPYPDLTWIPLRWFLRLKRLKSSPPFLRILVSSQDIVLIFGSRRSTSLLIPTQPLSFAALTFEDLLRLDQQWDVDRLSTLLLPDAIPFVIGIPPPFVTATDALSWNLTPTGTFYVSSAYAHLLESAWETIDPKWSWVWSLAVTPRIRMFVWLILKQRLMTNVERCRRGLSSDASCSSCDCVSETIIHILRDCPPTRLFWLSIIPPERRASFFAATLEDWVAANIRNTQNLHGSTIPWACFFPTLLWQLWKRRNDFIFTNACLPLPAIHKISVAWAKHFAEVSEAARAPRVSIVSHLQWLPPAPGWVCLNTDALLSPTTGVGMIGGVIRDSSGAWITGFQKCVGIVSVLQAELWSVLIGLQVARSSGVDRILVQSDCSHATKLLITALQPGHGVLQHDHELPLVRAIVLLCQDDWQVDFQWIPRELNMVADCLAKLSSPSQFNLLVSTVIPAQVRPLLDRDREGPPYLRNSRGVT
ncbi:hypothetical protein V6N11_010097 [Hibiscus sabdariffa]|uniref:Uncharacterized protein n=1 Tax=Hibiscus sabdariffa TaxID=183260 RepID=A0ABR2PDM0_9ROSI